MNGAISTSGRPDKEEFVQLESIRHTSVRTSTHHYYEALSNRGDFHRVAMADDLRFTGPLQHYADGSRYRTACRRLASRVRDLTIRHQLFEDDTPGTASWVPGTGRAHTVYDIDLALPTGPIASSETLTFVEGVLVSADLIIDTRPLRNVIQP